MLAFRLHTFRFCRVFNLEFDEMKCAKILYFRGISILFYIKVSENGRRSSKIHKKLHNTRSTTEMYLLVLHLHKTLDLTADDPNVLKE